LCDACYRFEKRGSLVLYKTTQENGAVLEPLARVGHWIVLE
jgi:hypothetical protein